MDSVVNIPQISGERIAISGLYAIAHDAHQLPSQLTLLKGHTFPACAECSAPVRFTLVRRMNHLDRLTGNIIVNSLPVLDKKQAA